jgi:hypothetical protein
VVGGTGGGRLLMKEDEAELRAGEGSDGGSGRTHGAHVRGYTHIRVTHFAHHACAGVSSTGWHLLHYCIPMLNKLCHGM